MKRYSLLHRYGFAWVTIGFFTVTIVGHWIFGWLAFADEQRDHGKAISVREYAVVMARDTLENWQSEFLQLLWQVAGLALLLHVGSPQSKEGDDRMEAKIDAILIAVAGTRGEDTIGTIDDSYEGRHTDTEYAKRLSQKVKDDASG